MKRYGKNYELISRKKMLITIIIMVILSLTFFIYIGIQSGYLGFSILISLIIIILMMSGQTFEEYYFDESAVHICYGRFTVKKINYDEIDTLVISNAVYTVHSRNLYGLKIGKKQFINGGNKFMQYGHISILPSNATCWRLKPEMSCLEVPSSCSEEVIYDCFFSFDSFTDLLSHFIPKIYILEDVYLRYENQFDKIIQKNYQNTDKFFVVSEKIYDYLDFQKQKGKCQEQNNEK